MTATLSRPCTKSSRLERRLAARRIHGSSEQFMEQGCSAIVRTLEAADDGRLGYESEAGFSRSFKRLFGTSSGEVRVCHRDGVACRTVPRVDRLPQHTERD
jgi:hypothetical protein